MLSKKIPDFTMRQFLLKNLDRNGDGSFSWKMNLQGLWKNYSNINVPIQSAAKVDVPTIVIRGGKSNYVTDNDINSFKEIFPNTKLITVPSSGHWVHAEAPDEFFEAVRSALYAAD
jgi:pimeloyl-ACP methyl ester carboxylesterase